MIVINILLRLKKNIINYVYRFVFIYFGALPVTILYTCSLNFSIFVYLYSVATRS